jgi:hypothetical protein
MDTARRAIVALEPTRVGGAAALPVEMLVFD